MATAPVQLYHLIMEHSSGFVQNVIGDIETVWKGIEASAAQTIIVNRLSEMAFVAAHELSALTQPTYKKALDEAAQVMTAKLCISDITQSEMVVDFIEEQDLIEIGPYKFSQRHFLRNFNKRFYGPVKDFYAKQGTVVQFLVSPDLSKLTLRFTKQ